MAKVPRVDDAPGVFFTSGKEACDMAKSLLDHDERGVLYTLQEGGPHHGEGPAGR